MYTLRFLISIRPQVFASLIERLQSLERVARSVGDTRSADRLEADIATTNATKGTLPDNDDKKPPGSGVLESTHREMVWVLHYHLALIHSNK